MIEICGGACYEIQSFWGIFDWIVTVIGPLCMIILSNMILIGRVFLQRRKMMRTNVWRNNQALLVQLLLITSLHCIAWLPLCIVSLISLVEVPSSEVIQELQNNWILVSPIYLTIIGFPVVCIFALPELRDKLRLVINYQRHHRPGHRIHPTSVNICLDTRH
ncbi:unnamed protein product [Rotaria socialis]|uniref:G-protein coupled receptors family 1 profile domain-containing protein n=1 Tax=Rotaria socialis TaxID=392032 RepID=A0A820ZBA5_9BILA|nr:unnamed protein product [Rotaria socialis]CAF3323261.1 unnamed protein product [Rotaria socialis]CAF4558742.1 unnamed protein product [Rotaria socialis]CAF4562720.1 unnamed protein product [Rotaria socialis]